MDRRNKEKGSALIIALLIVLLVSILGAGLLNSTLNSHIGVMASENNTKARYLAELGAKTGYNEVQQELEKFNQTSPSWSALLNEVQKINNLSGNGTPDGTQPRETYQYDIKLNDTPDQNNSSQGLYVISGRIRGIGTSNDRSATIEIPIQLSSLSKVFNFAVTAGNNIWLNGGVRVSGDLYAGNGIALHQIAHFSYNGQTHVTSTFPEINGKVSAGPLNNQINNIYYIDAQSGSGESDSVGKHTIPKNPISIDSISNYLNGNYEISKVDNLTLPQIDFNQVQSDIKQKANGKINWSSDKNAYHYVTDYFLWWENPVQFYIGDKTDNGSGPFNGTWYIHGNLYVDGNVNLNGTFYVDGDVDIQHIHSTNPIAAVIISNGSITVRNNNEGSSTPAMLNAFLWTQQDDLMIYGVGSNLQINGGIIAKNIILNGVRGSTVTGGWGLQFDTQAINKYPRLTINYDSQFIKNPPSGVPTIQGLQLKQNGNWSISQ